MDIRVFGFAWSGRNDVIYDPSDPATAELKSHPAFHPMCRVGVGEGSDAEGNGTTAANRVLSLSAANDGKPVMFRFHGLGGGGHYGPLWAHPDDQVSGSDVPYFAQGVAGVAAPMAVFTSSFMAGLGSNDGLVVALPQNVESWVRFNQLFGPDGVSAAFFSDPRFSSEHVVGSQSWSAIWPTLADIDGGAFTADYDQSINAAANHVARRVLYSISVPALDWALKRALQPLADALPGRPVSNWRHQCGTVNRPYITHDFRVAREWNTPTPIAGTRGHTSTLGPNASAFSTPSGTPAQKLAPHLEYFGLEATGNISDDYRSLYHAIMESRARAAFDVPQASPPLMELSSPGYTRALGGPLGINYTITAEDMITFGKMFIDRAHEAGHESLDFTLWSPAQPTYANAAGDLEVVQALAEYAASLGDNGGDGGGDAPCGVAHLLLHAVDIHRKAESISAATGAPRTAWTLVEAGRQCLVQATAARFDFTGRRETGTADYNVYFCPDVNIRSGDRLQWVNRTLSVTSPPIDHAGHEAYRMVTATEVERGATA